jgi:putative heme-binding domain-containing protein
VAKARPFFERAAVTAADAKRPEAERLAAARLLGHGPHAVAGPALQPLLTPQHSAELQLAAVRSLSLQDNAKIADTLLEGWSGYSPLVRREVIEALFARKDRLVKLLDAVEQKKIVAGQIEMARRDQLRKHPDATLRKRAVTLLAGQAEPSRQKIIDDYRPALDLRSEVTKGKEVFKRVCSTCHKLENVGTEVGPDLLSALRNKTPDVLIVDILDPSRDVDPRYINYVVTTKAGRSLTGLIAVETPASVTLRRAEKAEDTILRTQIDEITATGKSVMPDELEKQLTKQDLADLIAYLTSVAAPPK